MVQDQLGRGWVRSTSGSLRQSPGLLKGREEPLEAALFCQTPEWSKPPTHPFLLEKFAVGTGKSSEEMGPRAGRSHTGGQQTREENVPFQSHPLPPLALLLPSRPLHLPPYDIFIHLSVSLPRTEDPRGPGLHHLSPEHAERWQTSHYLQRD